MPSSGGNVLSNASARTLSISANVSLMPWRAGSGGGIIGFTVFGPHQVDAEVPSWCLTHPAGPPCVDLHTPDAVGLARYTSSMLTARMGNDEGGSHGTWMVDDELQGLLEGPVRG